MRNVGTWGILEQVYYNSSSTAMYINKRSKGDIIVVLEHNYYYSSVCTSPHINQKSLKTCHQYTHIYTLLLI